MLHLELRNSIGPRTLECSHGYDKYVFQIIFVKVNLRFIWHTMRPNLRGYKTVPFQELASHAMSVTDLQVTLRPRKQPNPYTRKCQKLIPVNDIVVKKKLTASDRQASDRIGNGHRHPLSWRTYNRNTIEVAPVNEAGVVLLNISTPMNVSTESTNSLEKFHIVECG